jgi:hypothetical protein
LPEN